MTYHELSMLFTLARPGPVCIEHQYTAVDLLRTWHLDSLNRRKPAPSPAEVDSTKAVFDAILATLDAEGQRQGVFLGSVP